MTIIITLFATGVLLLALEVVVPGGVLGILGGLCLLAGVTVVFTRFGLEKGALAALGTFALVGVTLGLEFVLLPKSRLARMLSAAGTVSGKSQPAVAERSVIGREAVAVTPLSPSGYVELDGRRYEAFARSGQARTGERLNIVDVDNFRLIVTKTSITQDS